MTDMSEEARVGRRPSTASILFFGLLAALGLLGASRVGGTSVEAVAAGSARAHVTSAKDHREKAAVARREAERHLPVVDRTATPAAHALPDAFRVR